MFNSHTVLDLIVVYWILRDYPQRANILQRYKLQEKANLILWWYLTVAKEGNPSTPLTSTNPPLELNASVFYHLQATIHL